MKFQVLLSMTFLAVLTGRVYGEGERRIALCVGVNEYEDQGIAAPKYAEMDIAEFASLLRDVGYKVVVMTKAASRLDPYLLPTKTNIEKQIAACCGGRKKEDLIVLAFVGRGIAFGNDPDMY